MLVGVLDPWAEQRKEARVLLVIDVSGSHGRPGVGDDGETKLDLAKQAAVDSLDQFKDDDEVGLRVFSTDLGPEATARYLDLVPDRRRWREPRAARSTIENQRPAQRHTALRTSPAMPSTRRVDDVRRRQDQRRRAAHRRPQRRRDPCDDQQQLDRPAHHAARGPRARTAEPVRLFTIGYGADADLGAS